MLRPIAAATAAVLTLLATTAAATPGERAAATRTATAQAAYACQMKYEGQAANAEEYADPTTLSLQLDVPTEVSAGESVSLRGTLALQFSEYLSSISKGYFDTFEGYSDSFSVALTIGGRTTVLEADRWQSPKTQRSNPLVVRAPVTFPTFVVPAGTSGSVRIGLPQNNVVKNSTYPAPATVAFNGRAQASGSFGTYKYDLSCYLPQASEGVVADIPVARAASAAKTGGKTGGKAGDKAGGEAGGGATSQATAAPAPAGAAPAPDVPTEPVADPFATATAVAAPGAPAATTPAAAGVATGPARDENGVYVPTGALVGGGLAVCMLALAYAAWAHLRLRRLRATLDG
ncbi:hypothetical protein GCM10009788_05960 [Nocardioides humi]|uniref:SDR-like Ig domain-containing protein n=2 Tax=Nocardioides humi TaxID=449461 RepID=A0ABN1ZW33_9ACTN